MARWFNNSKRRTSLNSKEKGKTNEQQTNYVDRNYCGCLLHLAQVWLQDASASLR